MLDTIESYLVAILPAATAVLSALAILIKVIAAVKEAKNSTKDTISQINAIVDSQVIETRLMNNRVDSFTKDSSELLSNLKAEISSRNDFYDRVNKTLDEYEKRLLEADLKIQELEQQILLNNVSVEDPEEV